ncbi:type I restriction endonuclease subunit R [Thiomicrospira sp. WB1]|uniref:type I restriction endonuclease subunit R n=1 Tax=Thiomicrospira sp. WB1 TaxID=1685380 RepID=UPI000747F356|nr:type I restriction endonuclease [Thiomicrospira sp. WB1]KUJ71661.1 restriction endonuclease subunit R [Thiomicrospira sp. WB1]
MKHTENVFETEIVDSLLSTHDWVEGNSQGYDRALALYPDDMLAYIKTTQPEQYKKFQKRYPKDTDQALVRFVAKQMDQYGSLYCLRNELKNVNIRFKLCQFKPDLETAQLMEPYRQNILRVVRQVYYSENNKNSIDLVLFLNGVPVATLELKTDFTQNVWDAVEQYRQARQPRDPATNKEEPLLAFKKRAMVHFAVSTDEVYMCTHLKGHKSHFLPFNKGNEGGAGNPPNPNGYATSYLWEDIFQKDTLLRIIGKFIHLEKKDKEDAQGRKHKSETLIFPRYHQVDAVRKIIEDVYQSGPGKNYLVQHSAGSGKSNSIAWSAHQLSSLHDKDNNRIFDSIIVVTDRNVLDSQLQETISQFERTKGVVQTINRTESGGSKSAKLSEALQEGASIIVVTIQTFPYVLEDIQKSMSLREKSFAIIADEAHSSQTGSTAKQLKKVLTSEQIEEGEELTVDDILAYAVQEEDTSNISHFAFTATPKDKTIQMFGTLPDPESPPSSENIPAPFHTYTMRQAIEEGFILDVLKHYTTYDVLHKLSSHDHSEVEERRAKAQITKWVKLHPYNIAQKVHIIIEHFKENVMHLLDGQAKAMVVTSSRKQAVRYKQAFDKYVMNAGYEGIQAMVAFSGSLVDEDQNGQTREFTEGNMNPGLKGREMRKAFDTDEYQVMIVANKFQTGFDQPKLCAMYVDKKLSGVDAVQTLARLNRIYPGKEDVFIIDFMNKPEEIKEAFSPFYETTMLSDVTDPNIIFEMQYQLEEEGIFTIKEVDDFADAYFDPNGKQEKMSAAVKPATDRFKTRYKAAVTEIKTILDRQIEAINDGDETAIHNTGVELKTAKEYKNALDRFKKRLTQFVRMYEFLSQIQSYEDTELEKLSAFCRGLAPNLATLREDDQIDLTDVELTHYSIKNRKTHKIDLKSEKLDPSQAGTAGATEPKTDTIENIVKQLNDAFAGELTDDDMVNYARTIADKVLEDTTTKTQLKNNPRDQAQLSDFPQVLLKSVAESMDRHNEMASQILSNDRTKALFTEIVLDMIYQRGNL